jgi:hypothetical protein
MRSYRRAVTTSRSRRPRAPPAAAERRPSACGSLGGGASLPGPTGWRSYAEWVPPDVSMRSTWPSSTPTTGRTHHGTEATRLSSAVLVGEPGAMEASLVPACETYLGASANRSAYERPDWCNEPARQPIASRPAMNRDGCLAESSPVGQGAEKLRQSSLKKSSSSLLMT